MKQDNRVDPWLTNHSDAVFGGIVAIVLVLAIVIGLAGVL